MNMNLTPQQQQALINAASQKLGIAPEQIAAMLQSGKAEELAARAAVCEQSCRNRTPAFRPGSPRRNQKADGRRLICRI